MTGRTGDYTGDLREFGISEALLRGFPGRVR